MKITEYLGETTEYDKKERLERRKPRSWLKSVSAFANSQGGALLFGVANDDILIGLSDAKGDAEAISEMIKTRMDPVPEVNLGIHTEAGKHFIRLEINAGSETPYYYVDGGTRTAYVRVGNESVPADAATLRRLVMRGTGKQFDAMSSRYRKDDLAFTKLRSFYNKQTGAELEESDFVSFGLVDANGNATNGGALLADDSPVRHSRVFCTRWAGLDKASGVMDAIDDEEFEGSLISLLQDTTAFIRANTKKRWKKNGNGRAEMPEYPERAVFETIVNALIHRDYLDTGSEVHVDIFDDRIEVYSPGGMSDGSFVQDLDPDRVPSRRRNPLIADVFGRMNLMERRGSGFRKIRAAYCSAVNFRPSLEPKFISTPSSFFAILYNLNYGISAEDTSTGDAKAASESETQALGGQKVAFHSADQTADGQKVAFHPTDQTTSDKKVAFHPTDQTTGDKKVAFHPTDQTADGQKVAFHPTDQTADNQKVAFRHLIEETIATAPTRKKVLLLFDEYGYHSVFGRPEIIQLTGLAPSSAGKLLNKLVALRLIERVSGHGRGKYRFIEYRS